MEEIKEVSLARIRERQVVPSIGDDLLLFDDIHMLPQLNDPRRMNCLIIGVCTAGNGGYTVNQVRNEIKAGDAIILTEGQIIDKVWMTEQTRGFALLISRDFMEEIFKELHDITNLILLARSHPIFHMEYDEIVKAKQFMDLIKDRITRAEYDYRKDVARLLIVTMIYDIGSAIIRAMSFSSSGSNSNKAKKCFVEFIQLVEHNFRRERRVSWYAEQIGITPKYLSEIISSTSNHSPNYWIDKYVTTEIRNQLRNTNKKISEIATDLNFPNQSFMGKYFRENAGLSPSEYRKGVPIRPSQTSPIGEE